MTELKIIEEVTGLKQVNCSCQTCVNMCKSSPCLGTPTDILKIIAAGHGDKIEKVRWAAGLIAGLLPIDLYMPKFDKEKGCVFLTEQNLCSLHDAGLKPIEGKVADCTLKELPKNVMPSHAVALTWKIHNQQHIVSLIKMALQK